MTSRFLITGFFILAVWNVLGGWDPDARHTHFLEKPASRLVTGLAAQIESRSAGNMPLLVPSAEATITWEWSTFLGTEMDEWCYDMEVDPAGNVLLLGLGQPESYWYGENSGPLQAGEIYLFVAKLSADGELLWQTFLGEETVSFG
ncbi:MAG: hypothetical protein HY781_13220, partial [Chloroflexi bacterium]|nr:hypothetical protein [Chloroflexota bacterium]